MGKHCWQCGKEKGKLEVFDIPVFKTFTIGWCFECASKQVYPDVTDWRFFKIHQRKQR